MPGDSHQQAARLQELHRYQILDTKPEPAFERIVELAQQIFRVPTVLVSLVAEERQWFKARRGLEACETDLASSFCVYAIEHEQVMVVLDATKDKRFRDTPLVTGDPFVRFYAGAPLITPAGHSLGTLCLLDSAPHTEFTLEAQKTLTDLASLVVDELELRLSHYEIERQVDSLRLRDQALAAVSVGFSIADARQADYPLIDCNPAFEQLTGYTREEVLGRNCRFLIGPETDPDTRQVIRAALRDERSCRVVVKNYRKDQSSFWNEFTLSPIRNSSGEPSHFIGIQVDISERVYAEMRLANQLNEHEVAERKAQQQAEFRRSLLEFTQTALLDDLGDDFHQALLESAVRTIPGAQAGSLLIKRGDKHHFAAAVGFDLEQLNSCTFSTEDSSFDLNSPEPQLVYGWQVEALDASRRSVMENYGLANDIAVTLCIPILINDEPYLSLYLDNFEDSNAFDTEAIEMARVLAQQVAALMQRKDLEFALRQKQVALEQLAHYDAVTGLPNRRLFDDRLLQAAAQSRRSGKSLAVMVLDLDNFKQINDTYGHSFGDRLLGRVATRLSRCMREGDTLARWGGDEFVVLVPELADIDNVKALAERLLQAMKDPFIFEGREIHESTTLGIALSDNTGVNPADLVKNADLALYRAKTTRGSYQVFTDAMREQLNIQIELGAELRAALKTDALTLHYQPRVNLTTGHITSFEALARWSHPTRGWVPPDVFIPLAEELGLIRELGAQVLGKACAQAKVWESSGVARRVAVNLSTNQLQHPNIVEEIQRALYKHDLQPELLELEITESTAMIDVERNIEKLQRLRDLGIHLAIDDFGTAYSSLAYLDKLPVHSLKIDRSFIKNMLSHNSSRLNSSTIVQTILTLGKSLDLRVVAEGVETNEQCALLHSLGCDEVQGYLFAAPMEAANVEELLKNHRFLKIEPTHVGL